MANAFEVTTQVAYFNNDQLGIGLADDVLNKAPALARLAARTIPGYVYTYPRISADPASGYRTENDGLENTAGTFAQLTVTCKILDASHRSDVATAKADHRGVDAWLGLLAARHLRAALAMAETQVFYGATAGESGGFAGLGDTMTDTDSAMVVDAGGTTADTASSVFLIKTGADPEDIMIVWGQDGEISVEERSIIAAAGSSTGTYPAYYQPITAWNGMQYGSAYSAGRICNLTADSGKGLTDALIATALEGFPSNMGPTIMAMNRRSLGQLQASRTATNSTGAPAPFPTEAFGVPIVVTDNIISTEALLTAA